MPTLASGITSLARQVVLDIELCHAPLVDYPQRGEFQAMMYD